VREWPATVDQEVKEEVREWPATVDQVHWKSRGYADMETACSQETKTNRFNY
jgi:hypothetical protein